MTMPATEGKQMEYYLEDIAAAEEVLLRATNAGLPISNGIHWITSKTYLARAVLSECRATYRANMDWIWHLEDTDAIARLCGVSAALQAAQSVAESCQEYGEAILKATRARYHNVWVDVVVQIRNSPDSDHSWVALIPAL